MSAQPSWHQLPVTHRGMPVLLASTTFTPTPASYTVRVTDLVHVWSESLDRRAILRRSLDEETVIDPSEDSENMRAFLEKLRAAFEPDHPEHDTTSLSLSVSDDSTGELALQATCVLPEPLRPLKWPMHLKKCLPSTLARELVVPLIQAQHALGQEIDALVETLREKDAVITKLIDKLEVTGTGLEHVFSLRPGRRKVTRALAEERVKGLAVFNEAEFRAKRHQQDADDSSAGSLSDLIQGVFGSGTGLRYRSDLDISDSSQLDGWWTRLGKGSVALAERQKEARKKRSTPPRPAMAKTAGDDDEFQVQSTPPHLMSARKCATEGRSAVVDDDETTDGEDPSQIPDSNPPLPPEQSPPKPAQPAKPSRIGGIGWKKKASPPAKPPPPPLTRRDGARQDDLGSETASDVDDTEASPPPPKPAGTQPNKGLGRIGGKPKAEPSQAMRSRTPDAPPSSQASKPAKGRLGHIGKRAAAPDRDPQSLQAVGGAERGRSRSPAAGVEEKEEKPRETSEERADRKRMELQRELDRKAAAGPAKKKRKF